MSDARQSSPLPKSPGKPADLPRQYADLVAREAELRHENQALASRVKELESANDDVRSSRRATLNVLEDAMSSRRLADELNHKLAGENADRRRAEETLRVSEQRARALIANLPGGAVFVVDADLRCRLAEGEALRNAGLKGSDFVGRSMAEALPPPEAAEFVPLFREALKGQSFFREHDSNGRAYLSRGVPLRDKNGDIEAVLAVSFDITARREAENAVQENQRQLQRALEAAQQAHQAKDQFIAALSHELRTPLTPILIAAGLNADDPKLSKQVRAQFETIRTNVQLEARLIDDLLDQTEIARGKVRLEKQEVDVHAILHAALLTVAVDFEAKGIKPKVQLKAQASRVQGDPVRLQQVFWNVLRNAAKFTEAGGRVTVQTSNPAKDKLVVTVTDTGIGLTPEETARMFQPFVQGDHAGDAAAKHFGGLGLGLAISRELAMLHGGEIEAASQGRDHGAVFTVILPALEQSAARGLRVRRKDSSAAGVPATPAAPAAPQTRQALLVEDHMPTRAALKVLLGRRGYKVTEAGSVKEAVDNVAGNDYDLIVSDLGLPDGTGHEVIRKVRIRQPQATAIALSGFGMDTDVQKALAAGFSVHLTKPVGVEQLDATLDKLEQAATG